jgi:hypothetical protein
MYRKYSGHDGGARRLPDDGIAGAVVGDGDRDVAARGQVTNGKDAVSLPQLKGIGRRAGPTDDELWCGARLCCPCPAAPLPSRNDCTRTTEQFSFESFGEKKTTSCVHMLLDMSISKKKSYIRNRAVLYIFLQYY